MPRAPQPEIVQKVLAQYGLAMCLAQSLEKRISVLLHSTETAIREGVAPLHDEDLLKENLTKTFGAVLIALRDKIDCPGNVQERLDQARQRRNWLAHDYWWQRAVALRSDEGCAEMLAELDEQVSFFNEMNALFQQILLTYLSLRGAESDWIRDELAPLLEQPETLSPGERRLGERETLIGIWIQTCRGGDERVETPLFEMADHTWWALSEDGLTPGPVQVDLPALRLRKDYQRLLPAEITPRPANAAGWNYSMPLSNGYYIWVSPSTHNGMWKLRWGMRKTKERPSAPTSAA